MNASASSRTGSTLKIRQRQTKVVATLGPASGTIEVIRELVAAGADVFRLNFSHGVHEEHRGRFDIASTVGVGTTVTVLLPAAAPVSSNRQITVTQDE